MGFAVPRIKPCKVLVLNDQEVLGVLCFNGIREVERPGHDGLAVAEHNLVVGESVLGIH